MKVGDLLLPNAYQVGRGKPVAGIVLEVKDDIFGPNYRVHLTNGTTRWMGEDVIRELFEVVSEDR